ncbi:unnamed protein product [Colias eurytheme]|nr:unnamed protein product [Colias eurytheme]
MDLRLTRPGGGCLAADGVSPRAPGGGGEPRAARLDAARGRSAPPPRAPRCPPASPSRRARSAAPVTAECSPAPRLRPVFLWARQLDGTVQEVHCEDYDSRNRIRIARTPDGWRVIPRTEIYNSIRVPPPPPAPPRRRNPRERRRRKRRGNSRRRPRSNAPPVEVPPPAPPVTSPSADHQWLAPDLESHIPSHTIAVPRQLPPEATPLDNLLAVAELEFNQQQNEGSLEPTSPSSFGFLPPEETVRETMSYEIGQPKATDEMFYERKASLERSEEFPGDMSEHKDLFETISEAHYLPELAGPHDEALLESLVEKGCEDNQILGQALDKLAHLVQASGEYPEEEEDMLLGNAPVSDIIDRLEQSLESPSRSSMTAAQGLLHLHHIGDHLQQPDQGQIDNHTYISDDVFVPEEAAQCALESLTAATEMQEPNPTNEIKDIDYKIDDIDNKIDKNLENEIGVTDEVESMFTDPVPDSNENFIDKQFEEPQAPPALPDQSEVMLPIEPQEKVLEEQICEPVVPNCEKSDGDPSVQHTEEVAEPEQDDSPIVIKQEEPPIIDDSVPTDLSIVNVDAVPSPPLLNNNEVTNTSENNISELPRDLSVHKRLPTPVASPRRIDLPRAPSRESDAMQSPQPSGIPAVPSSPEIFTMPLTKSKQTLFLETLLSSPSPKMYTSEVTITKQQCEPLNLGKHRKSASPTVSSCSDEIKKLSKEFGEPLEKKRRESIDDLAKISKVFNKCSEDPVPKKPDRPTSKPTDVNTPLQQFNLLKSRSDYTLPDPLLIPKDKLEAILVAPAREIPALLIQRPELRLPATFAFPAILQDPDILVVSLTQLEQVLIERETRPLISPKSKDGKLHSSKGNEKGALDQAGQPKPIPSMDALAGDIDAATSAALNQMLWLPYLSQLEAMAACSQNMDFIKALNSSGYNGSNYPELSQMFNPSARFMGAGGFPVMPSMDYDNRMQFAMWQEAMSHGNPAATHRTKPPSVAEQLKELSKSGDVQNPYVHSTKSQSKTHSAARTSPIAHNYNNQRAMPHNPFMQGMYPGMNPNMRPNMQLPGLQIPYFNQQMMSQRSPRTGQQKSPTSPYYPNNNYLQSVKQSEHGHQRSNSTSSQESPRPRISVKSLQNLLEPSAAAASAVAARRSSATPSAALGRRRDEPEVGSTTPGEPPPHHLPPHPHDPASFHLWHPLFGK